MIFSSGVAVMGICGSVLPGQHRRPRQRRETNFEFLGCEVSIEPDGIDIDTKKRDCAHTDPQERMGRQRKPGRDPKAFRKLDGGGRVD